MRAATRASGRDAQTRARTRALRHGGPRNARVLSIYRSIYLSIYTYISYV